MKTTCRMYSILAENQTQRENELGKNGTLPTGG